MGHDGKANRRYREAAQVAHEYRKLAPFLAGTTPRPQVAIIYDYDSIWALQDSTGISGAPATQEAIKRYYNALFRAGVNVDIVRPGDDLSGYKLVLAPHLHVLADDVANQLVEFVSGGGVLLADCRTGVKDETNLAYDRTLPGLLSPALGIEIDEYESLALGITDKEEDDLQDPNRRASWAKATLPCITPTGSSRRPPMPLARYDQPHLKEFAAVTRNEFGEGIGWYVGTIVSETGVLRQVDRAAACGRQDSAARPAAGGRGSHGSS